MLRQRRLRWRRANARGTPARRRLRPLRRHLAHVPDTWRVLLLLQLRRLPLLEAAVLPAAAAAMLPRLMCAGLEISVTPLPHILHARATEIAARGRRRKVGPRTRARWCKS